MGEARFEPHGFLHFDLGAGRVSSRDDKRHLVVPAEVLAAAGDRGALFEAARRWGAEQGGTLAELLGADVLAGAPEQFLTELSHFVSTLGFGRCELEAWGSVLFAVVAGAPEGAGADVLAGLLAGAFGAVAKARFECIPMPEERFLLLGPEGADQVRGWVDSGARAGEVVSRMLAGEHLSAGGRG